jgi:protein-S-isoprenylcysteine O-methyltransferase Ste14
MDADPNLADPGMDHAGVSVPPPALFIGSLLLGIFLEWAFPIGVLSQLSAGARFGIGGGLIVAGVAMMASAMRLFRRAGTAIPPWEPTTALVTTGPYRFSRNPIYLSVVTLYVGIALLFAASWALVLLVPALVILHYFVIRREEAYLDRRFGETYRQYRARVRRWI